MPDFSKLIVDVDDDEVEEVKQQQFSKNAEEFEDEEDEAPPPRDEVASDNSGDSPHQHEQEEEEQEDEAEIPKLELLSTHRGDGVLCPKLTRPGYRTVPSLETLATWPEDKLYACRDFTVVHDEHGTIKWEGLSDIRSLDLDKIVFIEHGKIEVYPDELHDKPKQNEFLNKFARITLKNVWPPKHPNNRSYKSPNKTGKEEVDEERLDEEVAKTMLLNYGAKLAQHCMNHDCKFIRYDTKNGSWTFSVEHFTIYGLPGETKPKPVTNTTNRSTTAQSAKAPAISPLYDASGPPVAAEPPIVSNITFQHYPI